MPLINHQGERISYECEDLIKELEDDIAEFGGDMIVDVVTMRAKGVTLYIDYNFVEEGKPPFELREYESHKLMKASMLSALLKMENSIC